MRHSALIYNVALQEICDMCSIEAQDGFEMVGAYPGGKKNARGDEWDMCYGKNDRELDEAVANIQSVQMLVKDPVYGDHGPVFDFWKN